MSYDDLQGIQMKAVMLAGGMGTRLSEETYLKPKPLGLKEGLTRSKSNREAEHSSLEIVFFDTT